MSTVFLAGFMGAGKTTVGRALAARLGWQFADLDERIAQRHGGTIAQVFAAQGEAGFRRAESLALQELLRGTAAADAVIALGGGTLMEEANRHAIRDAGGFLVFLDAPADELWQRSAEPQGARPLRGGRQQFAARYRARREQYLAAPLRVETAGKTPEEVAGEIASRLGLVRLREEEC